MELRDGIHSEGQMNTDSLDTILAMPIDLLFDFAAVHLDGPKATSLDLTVDFTFTGANGAPDADWHMWIRNGVLNARSGLSGNSDLHVSGPKPALAALLLQPGDAEGIVAKHGLKTEGDLGVFTTIAAAFDTFDPHFPISTP